MRTARKSPQRFANRDHRFHLYHSTSRARIAGQFGFFTLIQSRGPALSFKGMKTGADYYRNRLIYVPFGAARSKDGANSLLLQAGARSVSQPPTPVGRAKRTGGLRLSAAGRLGRAGGAIIPQSPFARRP
jgi:hypothetical protein